MENMLIVNVNGKGFKGGEWNVNINIPSEVACTYLHMQVELIKELGPEKGVEAIKEIYKGLRGLIEADRADHGQNEAQ